MKMKRYIGYLSVLVAIALLYAGCEKENPTPPTPPTPPVEEPVHEIKFAPIEITPSQKEALIETKSPEYTIDGVAVQDFEWGLEYAYKSSSEWESLLDGELSGDTYIFTLSSLEPQTEYKVRQWAKSNLGEFFYSEEEQFKTKNEEVVPDEYKMAASIGEITPYGLYAMIELKSVRYLINGTDSQIKELELEYSLTSEENYKTIEVRGWDYSSSLVVEIPSVEGEFLQENSDYKFRLVVAPAEVSAPELSSEEYNFSTVSAQVSVQIPSPEVTDIEEGLLAQGSGVSILKDGRLQQSVSNISIEYSIQNQGSWEEEVATLEDQKYWAVIPAQNLRPETTYLIRTKVQTSDDVYYSEVVTYTTPKEDDPEQPPVIPPEGGDTSMMEGVWKLVQWRDSQPSFEVYMEIDATGGVLLWQKIDSRNWEKFLSAAYTEDGVISGVYDDGVAWGASYYYSVNGDSMTWTDTQDSSDVSVYQRSTLPADLQSIKRSSEQTTASARFL